MIDTKLLELGDARAVVEAAKKEAVANGWKISVCVVDAGGHPILYERMDGVAPATARISMEKARTAAIFRLATAIMEDRIPDRLGTMVLPGATPLKGGVPLMAAGQVVGAVGISGLAPQQDHQVGEAAAAALK
jgi:glc operon protein GlcG